ncbi:MAG: DNA polymerase III subunit delta [Ferrimonas sp.]
MKIYASKLAQFLPKLPTIVLVFGDDVLIRESCREQVRQQLMQKEGVEERLSLVQTSPFDWSQLLQEAQSLSLFASRRLIELELPSLKPGTEGAAALVTIAEQLSQQQDTYFLLHGPKPGREHSNSKWLKALEKVGLYVQALTPEGVHYQRWLKERAQHHQLQLPSAGFELLGRMFEGNLLAADQTMAQLGLLSAEQPLTLDELTQLLADQSRYSVYQLTDALLAGQDAVAIKMLNQLQLEDTAPTLMAWAIGRELQLLCRLHEHLQQGRSAAESLKAEKVWPAKAPLYQGALNRLSLTQVAGAFAMVGQFEQALKLDGATSQEAWLRLADLCARFNGQYQPMPQSLFD